MSSCTGQNPPGQALTRDDTLRIISEARADRRRVDLSGANLRFANLRGADLSGINLRYADLRGTVLSFANLRGADLSGINLRYADLRGADLSGINLRYADLRGANLHGANLSYANLSGANLNDANLSYANLSGANLNDAILSSAILSGADLTGADLTGAILTGADLNCANLHGAKLYTSIWDGLSLSGLRSGYAIHAPTSRGWQTHIGCWSGTLNELEELIAKDTGWPEATGDECAKRRPELKAFITLARTHEAYHPDAITKILSAKRPEPK